MISWGECSPLHVDVLLIGRLLASISDLKKKSSTYLSVSYSEACSIESKELCLQHRTMVTLKYTCPSVPQEGPVAYTERS